MEKLMKLCILLSILLMSQMSFAQTQQETSYNCRLSSHQLGFFQYEQFVDVDVPLDLSRMRISRGIEEGRRRTSFIISDPRIAYEGHVIIYQRKDNTYGSQLKIILKGESENENTKVYKGNLGSESKVSFVNKLMHINLSCQPE